jgi:hypothetical protein
MAGMSSGNVYGLMLIVTTAWVLILVESYVFIVVIRPLGPPIHSPVPSSVLKVILTAGLGVLWVAVMFAMDALYSRWKRTPT